MIHDGADSFLDGHGCLKAAGSASCDIRKLSDYALSYESPKGREKAKVFEAVLGFTLENQEDLRNQILDKLKKYPAQPRGDKGFGQEFQVPMPIEGPRGKAVVMTGWVHGSDGLRLTTLRVGKAKEQMTYRYLLEAL